MMLSIVHRGTGLALYFGTLLLAWWLISAASGPGAYANVQAFTSSIIGRLPAEINAAGDWLWRGWLAGSSYQPADRPSLELRRDFETLTVGRQLRCELCLPVGPP
ncbi:MAG: succinate dehydrogenase / fumarate reductase, cytochrome b subunit [Bradyrhizobium sp.]|jgi:hypothetical protein|nr:succinate dehydrogenase / fumarate reductase, cytochrome b subunit [Bradyrhizobium sp.]